MQLAPQPQLSGYCVTIPGGVRGVRRTLDTMRALVRAFRVNPQIRQAATSLIFTTPERMALSEASAIFDWVQASVRYVRDVHEVETLSTPLVTLQGRIGDCDDQVTLLASLLESVGYPTRFVAAGYTEPGYFDHVYMQAFLDGEWVDMDPTERNPMGWAPPDPVALLIEGV